VAGVWTVVVGPVNRVSGAHGRQRLQVLPTLAVAVTSPPTLAALGVGCRERIRQGWQDASRPALRSGLSTVGRSLPLPAVAASPVWVEAHGALPFIERLVVSEKKRFPCAASQ